MTSDDVSFDALVERQAADDERLEAEEPCPACDSDNIVYGGPENKSALCLDCGKEWFV